MSYHLNTDLCVNLFNSEKIIICIVGGFFNEELICFMRDGIYFNK